MGTVPVLWLTCRAETAMNLERLRQICLALPGATEQIQWGADLVFKVGGKMFCVACTEQAPNIMSLKCDDESFAEMCEREGCIPAPYLARAKWVAIEQWSTLEDREYEPIVERAYTLVRGALPKKTQAALGAPVTAPAGAVPAKAKPVKSNSAKAKAKTSMGGTSRSAKSKSTRSKSAKSKAVKPSRSKKR
jgi:predicted DNA-binding protein (MmcQ/YjbR family)